MTREEAIAELNVLHERLLNPKDCEDGCYSWEDGWYVEAIDMAIEALKAEPNTNSFHYQRYVLYEPLIRCKDCRHGQYDATHYFCAEHHHKVYEDDYCSHGQRLSNLGERKGGEDE